MCGDLITKKVKKIEYKTFKNNNFIIFCSLWVSCEDPNDEQANNQNNNDDPQESSTIGQDLAGSRPDCFSIF